MKKDLVIDLLRKIQENNLSIEDSKSLFNRSENFLQPYCLAEISKAM